MRLRKPRTASTHGPRGARAHHRATVWVTGCPGPMTHRCTPVRQPHAPTPRPSQPLQARCRAVLQERYLLPGERDQGDVFARVARGLAQAERPLQRAAWERRFLRHLHAGAIGAGRIMHAAGAGARPDVRPRATLINCFVHPLGGTLRGRDEQGRPGLEPALREAARTLARGGGVGLDFSAVPADAVCAWIDRFDALSAALETRGARRGALMAVLPIEHPAAPAFIEAKRQRGRWTRFNVSVAVGDAFMQALLDESPGEGRGEGRGGGSGKGPAAQPPRELWCRLAQAACDTGDPGVLFIDRIRRDDNLRNRERIAATNPCGEQPLPPYGACALGPLILPRFVLRTGGRGGAARLDFEALRERTAMQVRLLDNVLDLTRWPLPQHREQALATRRIGVGFTGLADALAMLGLPYGSPQARAMAARIARTMRDAAYRASIDLAAERGPFPRFDASAHLADGTFASRLPAPLRARIAHQGIRNSHLLSIAPTGSVSLAFANHCSTGIEPALAGATAIAPLDHVAMVAAVQPFVDAGISKTVNLAPGTTADGVQALFVQAWRSGLKGLTVFTPQASTHATAG